jgi:DNA-binding transcriptional LysR family regulator
VCESASAEALVAQARAGLGAAFIPKMLADDTLVVCTVPKKLAMTYEILRLGKNKEIT